MRVTKKPSLAQTHPGIATEALDWNPFHKTWSSPAQVRWRCPEGHHYSESIVERVKNGRGCSYCITKSPRKRATERSRITKVQKERNLEERHWTKLHPKIAKQADGWDPQRIKNGSKIEKKWICSRQHHFRMSVEDRVKHRAKHKLRCNKCQKWRPRSISIFKLADALLVDRIEFWRFTEQIYWSKRNPERKMTIAAAEKIVDKFYDKYSTTEILAHFKLKKEKDSEYQTGLIWSINERCSSCGVMFDTQRSHECRNY